MFDPSEYSYKHLRYTGNPVLANFGASMKLPSGSSWILGDGFAFQLSFDDNSYEYFSSIKVFNKEITGDEWYILQIQLAKYRYTIHTLKSQEDVSSEIGLEVHSSTQGKEGVDE